MKLRFYFIITKKPELLILTDYLNYVVFGCNEDNNIALLGDGNST